MVGAMNNPYAVLKDADFSVLLSKSEAYPMTVIESFILGVPIVVSRFGSIEEMMLNGLLKKDDATMLAFSYTAPITAFVHFCDREPQRQSEAMRQIKKFIRHFIKIYGVKV